jgi:hypothetical protein
VRRAVTIALLCALSGVALAQDGAVTGTLITPDGKAVTDYPVVVSRTSQQGEPESWVASTDATGKFKLDDLPPGKYVVSPGNDPSVAKTFELRSSKSFWSDLFKAPPTTGQDLGAIQVDAGSKLRAPSD